MRLPVEAGCLPVCLQQLRSVGLPNMRSMRSYVDIQAQALLEAVQKALARAEKDNDLIYHQEVPAASSLPQIKEVGMVQPVISDALREPKNALGNDAVIFGELLGYGAKVAISLFFTIIRQVS